MTAGTTAGVVISVLIGVAIIMAVIFFLHRRGTLRSSFLGREAWKFGGNFENALYEEATKDTETTDVINISTGDANNYSVSYVNNGATTSEDDV